MNPSTLLDPQGMPTVQANFPQAWELEAARLRPRAPALTFSTQQVVRAALRPSRARSAVLVLLGVVGGVSASTFYRVKSAPPPEPTLAVAPPAPPAVQSPPRVAPAAPGPELAPLATAPRKAPSPKRSARAARPASPVDLSNCTVGRRFPPSPYEMQGPF